MTRKLFIADLGRMLRLPGFWAAFALQTVTSFLWGFLQNRYYWYNIYFIHFLGVPVMIFFSVICVCRQLGETERRRKLTLGYSSKTVFFSAFSVAAVGNAILYLAGTLPLWGLVLAFPSQAPSYLTASALALLTFTLTALCFASLGAVIGKTVPALLTSVALEILLVLLSVLLFLRIDDSVKPRVYPGELNLTYGELHHGFNGDGWSLIDNPAYLTEEERQALRVVYRLAPGTDAASFALQQVNVHTYFFSDATDLDPGPVTPGLRIYRLPGGRAIALDSADENTPPKLEGISVVSLLAHGRSEALEDDWLKPYDEASDRPTPAGLWRIVLNLFPVGTLICLAALTAAGYAAFRRRVGRVKRRDKQ